MVKKDVEKKNKIKSDMEKKSKNRVKNNKNQEEIKKLKDKISELEDKNTKLIVNNTNKIVDLKNEINKNKKNINILRVIIIIFILIVLYSLFIFNKTNKEKDNYKNKLAETKSSLATEYLFLGDSIIYRYNLQMYLGEYPVINSGIGGNKTQDILDNLENRVYKYKPTKLILLIGINDLTHFKDEEYVSKNIEKITNKIHKKFPKCKIYIESIYPINNTWKERSTIEVPSVDDITDKIKNTNKKIKELCKKNGYTYINMFDLLKDDDGHLILEYTNDGIHPNEEGYKVITNKMKEVLQ